MNMTGRRRRATHDEEVADEEAVRSAQRSPPLDSATRETARKRRRLSQRDLTVQVAQKMRVFQWGGGLQDDSRGHEQRVLT